MLVLHAKDDFIVPYESGQRLFEVACEEGGQCEDGEL